MTNYTTVIPPEWKIFNNTDYTHDVVYVACRAVLVQVEPVATLHFVVPGTSTVVYKYSTSPVLTHVLRHVIDTREESANEHTCT